jgi:hypothetical protein
MTAEYTGSGELKPVASIGSGDPLVKGTTSEEVKKNNERFFGDLLVDELNRRNGSSWKFEAQDGEPDLVYRDDRKRLNVEVTCAYYADCFAKNVVQHMRGHPSPQGAYRMDPEGDLLPQLGIVIGKKSKKDYGPCVLLVGMHAYMSTPTELEALLLKFRPPTESNRYSEMYVVAICGDGSSGGGCYIWRLTPAPVERLAF